MGVASQFCDLVLPSAANLAGQSAHVGLVLARRTNRSEAAKMAPNSGVLVITIITLNSQVE